MAETPKKVAAREQQITEDQVSAFTLKLEKFLNKHIGKIVQDIKVGADNAMSAAQALSGLEDSLIQMGLEDVLSDIAEIYGDRLNYIKAKFANLAEIDRPLNQVDIDVTQQLIQFDTEVIKLRTFESAASLKSEVMKAVLTGGVKPYELVTDETGKLTVAVDTELNTAIAGFDRSVSLAQADEFGIDLFLYNGDIIETTRDYCRKRVGIVWTREELEASDNEQGLDPMIYQGGYNCRHSLDAISKQKAIDDDYPLSPGAQALIDGV